MTALGDLAQNRVGEARSALVRHLPSELDRFVDHGVRRQAQKEQLIDAQSQRREQLVLNLRQWAIRRLLEHVVESP